MLRKKSRVLAITSMLAGAGVVACVHEGPKQPPSTPHDDVRPTGSTFSPPQYLVADPLPSKGAPIALPLGAPGVHGLVVDKRRVLIGQGEPRVAPDTAPETIIGTTKVPNRLGGGFLFWTSATLYRADSFDGKLLPVTRVPDAVESISFAPKSMLVRTHNGERWAINLPNGARVAIEPLGIADVQALDDGRAIGFNDQGAVFTSTDNGAHWIDATAQVKGQPSKVSILGGELWLFDTNASASRLEADGHLAWFDKAPPETAPELRPKDPRWRGSDTPLRAVFRTGAAIDESSAIVLDAGDLVRVDVHTGDILSIVPGRLPPDAQCEAVPVTGDVLFACVSRASGGSAFVVSHTLSSESPVVEQTLSPGGGFFASDDGGLAYVGSCSGVAPTQPQIPAACVRLPGGHWEERDVSGLSTDGGTNPSGSPDITVARWVPRADGRVVAIVIEPIAGIYDPIVGSFMPIAEEAKDFVGRVAAGGMVPPRFGKPRIRRPAFNGPNVVDASWSFSNGSSLRGWQRHGESVEIADDGKITHSPYAFDVVFSGAMGLGRSKDGRLYQSVDHGASWTEVATPPAGIESVDLVDCTSAGCDLGAFYRVGWSLRPPHVEPAKTPAPPAPEVRHVRGLELSCRPVGAIASKSLSRNSESPEDLGLGVSRLPIANDRTDWGFIRNAVTRTIVSPIHDAPTPDDNGAPSLRALFSGFGTSNDGDVITVTGPNKSAMALRRGFSYIAPFDPSGRVVRTSIAMSDVVAAGRRAGMTTDEVLKEDLTETGTIVTLTSADPSAPSDVAFQNAEKGLIGWVRGERVRVAIRTSQNSAVVTSGVNLPNDEAAFLEIESGSTPLGVGHVFKMGASGVLTDLFDISGTAGEAFYPANPDALAVGPKGDLAILRTPSGSDPPSALDPAYLVVQAMPPTALAPWSELKLADDPLCKADKDGYRAALQILAPWIRVTTPELRVEETPMIARVRWSAKRLCLEGFEVKLPPTSIRTSGGSSSEAITFATWLTAKGSSFARVGVTEGIEWRQNLECSIVSTGP